MKKNQFGILAVSTVFMGSLLSSCLGDSTNKYYNESLCTVGSNNVLYCDYGGIVYPTYNSVSDLTGSKGLTEGDRVYMQYSYTDDNMIDEAGKGIYIKEADLVAGQRVPKVNIMLAEEAESKKQLEADSLFKLPEIRYLGVYRGYLTARFQGSFSVISNKAIYPSLNMVFDLEENKSPNEMKLKMIYNRHSKQDAQVSSDVFFATYPLTTISNFIAGNDSVNVTITGEGLSKPYTIKMSRTDFYPGNYEYFK